MGLNKQVAYKDIAGSGDYVLIKNKEILKEALAVLANNGFQIKYVKNTFRVTDIPYTFFNIQTKDCPNNPAKIGVSSLDKWTK